MLLWGCISIGNILTKKTVKLFSHTIFFSCFYPLSRFDGSCDCDEKKEVAKTKLLGRFAANHNEKKNSWFETSSSNTELTDLLSLFKLFITLKNLPWIRLNLISRSVLLEDISRHCPHQFYLSINV